MAKEGKVTVIEHCDPESGNTWVEILCPSVKSKQLVQSALFKFKPSTVSKNTLAYVFMNAREVAAILISHGISHEVREPVFA